MRISFSPHPPDSSLASYLALQEEKLADSVDHYRVINLTAPGGVAWKSARDQSLMRT
jgi:hypothetical protein